MTILLYSSLCVTIPAFTYQKDENKKEFGCQNVPVSSGKLISDRISEGFVFQRYKRFLIVASESESENSSSSTTIL